MLAISRVMFQCLKNTDAICILFAFAILPAAFATLPAGAPPRLAGWDRGIILLTRYPRATSRTVGLAGLKKRRVGEFMHLFPPPPHWNSNKMSLFVRATGCLLSGAFFFPSPLWAVAVMPLLSQKKKNHKTARQHSFSPHSSFSR